MSRAIHLEVTPSLDTDSFINTLRRFIAVRGPVRQIRCDLGTNFVGADNELYHDFNKMDQDQIKKHLLEKNCDYIKFKFNVPHASHMGGAWERQIRTVRSVLRPLLENHGSQLDDDSLHTLFYEVMAIVNSRPLTLTDINDPLADILTPNSILTMKSKVVLPPPGNFVKEDIYLRKKWRRVQYLLNLFWSKWKTEYLISLQPRPKWNETCRNMAQGNIVILKEDEMSPRNKWPLAVVEEAIQSDDGLVRKVKVRVADAKLDKFGRRISTQTILERPIHKCVTLIKAEDRGIPPPRSQ